MPKLRRPSSASPTPRTPTRPDAGAGTAAWQRIAAWMSPRRLFRAFFVDQVRLRRAGTQVVIALEPAAAPAVAEPPKAEVAVHALPASPASAADRMHAGLRRLLDGSGDSRQVLRHLAALEKRLGQGDASFIHALSTTTLQQMLRQLQGLVAPPPSDGVALLLAELQETIENRHRIDEARQLSQPTSTFLVEAQPEVTELDPATLDMEFDETPRSPKTAPEAAAAA